MTTLIFKPCQCGRAVAHYHWSCHCGKTKITSIVSWWSCSLMLMMITTTSAKIELKKGCSTLRRKLRRDETTAGWCIGGPCTRSSLTRRNKKLIFYTRLSLGSLRSACFGRSSPWAAADQEISRGDYKEYNIADLCRGCWPQSSSTWPHLAQGPTLLCFGVLHLSSSNWSCKFGSSINGIIL